jgi:hypothetical protein
VHDRDGKRSTFLCTPLGVASTLRRVKSKAPALHRRAESPVISSTGQRPVDTSMSRQPALKGRNPHSFDSAPSRRGRMCITVCKRNAAYGYGVHLHSKSRRDGIIPPLRGWWGKAASTPRVTPSASPAGMHILPFQGYGHRSPLFTGCCQVVFGRKRSFCAVRHNMLVENEISCTIPPSVPSGTECVIETGYIFLFSIHIPSLTGRGEGRRPVFSTNILCLTAQKLHFFPNTIGRCPVLMICGLSALLPPDVETQCIASLPKTENSHKQIK